MSKASSLKRKRRIFGWVFVVSIFVFFASSTLYTRAPMRPMPESMPKPAVPPPMPKPAPEPHLMPKPAPMEPQSGLDTAVIVSAISLLTSLTSLVGFFSTTVLAWRREKRETLSAELEIQKKELELEKLRMELSKSSEGRKNESA
jgi:hypothetical protein